MHVWHELFSTGHANHHRRLLVTAPLTALQTGEIHFQPPLPLRKQVKSLETCLLRLVN